MEKTTEFNIEAFNKLVEAIAKGQAKTARDIGKAILCAVYLSINEKDAGAANALIKCLRKSTKLTAIVDTLEAYGNLAFMKSNGNKFEYFEVEDRAWPSDKAGVDKLRTACMDWESFKKERVVEALDVAEKLESLISAVAKAQKNNREVVHAELIESVAKLVAEFHIGQK